MKKATIIIITPSAMFAPTQRFIRTTFCRVARDKYKLTHEQSEKAFDRCKSAGLIESDSAWNDVMYYKTNEGFITL
jgi:hypothetical protein